jgi:hypothetical protein
MADQHETADICCTLSDADAVRLRIDDWRSVLEFISRRTKIDGGLRLELRDDAPIAEVVRLAEAEHGCCTFFAFALTIDSRGTALEVRAPAEAATLVRDLFGG